MVWMRWFGVSTYGSVLYRRIPYWEPQHNGPYRVTAEVARADVDWAHPSLDPAVLLKPAARKLVSEDDRSTVLDNWMQSIWNNVVGRRNGRLGREASRKMGTGELTYDAMYDRDIPLDPEKIVPGVREARLAMGAKVMLECEEYLVNIARARDTTTSMSAEDELEALEVKLAAVQGVEAELEGRLVKTAREREGLQERVKALKAALDPEAQPFPQRGRRVGAEVRIQGAALDRLLNEAKKQWTGE
ncbi:hypothetical protein LTR95_007511 [Oleoguttula sp. CCFEE 5521]